MDVTLVPHRAGARESGYFIRARASLMDEHREAMGIHEKISGVLVTHVDDGSPAQRAGVKGCDKK
jgi:S1-C subfamily serine protease